MTAPDGAHNADLRAVLDDTFWRRVKISEDGCWLWLGSINRQGYGSWAAGRNRLGTQFPHRCIWIVMHGPVPDGYEVDHRCFTPGCLRPSHLQLLTVRENRQQRRIWLMHRPACPQGHPYDETNTYMGKRPDGRRYMKCRECMRAANKVYRAKNPERERERFREYRRRKAAARRLLLIDGEADG